MIPYNSVPLDFLHNKNVILTHYNIKIGIILNIAHLIFPISMGSFHEYRSLILKLIRNAP